MQPSALTADGRHRYHTTGVASITACENPYRNAAENLRMCDSCIKTHSRIARQYKKNYLENNTLHTLFFFVQDGFPPLLFTFNPYRHAYVRI